MTLSININSGSAVNGGNVVGLMTSAGNPWSVPDALALELVNRNLATPLSWPVPFPNSASQNVAMQSMLSKAGVPGLLQAQKLTAVSSAISAPRVASGGGTQNYTWGHVLDAWGDFNAVQVLFSNPTGSSLTIDNCIVAASANATVPAQPTGAWSAATGALTVPAGGGTAANPGFLLTPKIPLKSIPRNDGGRYPLIYARCFFQTGNTTYVYVNGGTYLAAANWAPYSEGHTILSASIAGDQVTTPGGWVSGGVNTNPLLTLSGFVFTYDYPMISIAGVGDSIMEGDWSTVVYDAPFGFKAVSRLNAAGKRVSWINAGMSGQLIGPINVRGKALIDAVAPSIIIISSYTINSPVTTQADWDAQWYYVMDLAAYQVSKGGQVLIMTPWVNNGFSAPTDAIRQIQRSRVINSGYPYADVESATSNGAVPAQWKSGMNFDNTHPLDIGHEAIQAVVQAALLAYGMVG